MKKILVAGGAGFVGSALAAALKERHPRHSVTAFDNLRRRGSELNLPRLKRLGIRFVHGDVSKPEDFDALEPPDFLIECSADPSVLSGITSSPFPVIQANLVGTARCLDFAAKHRSRFLYLSTSRIYPIDALERLSFREAPARFEFADRQPVAGVSRHGIAETFPLAGHRSFYGATKLASELLIEEYRRFYGLKAIVNRCGILAGPRQMGKSDQGLVALWAAAHVLNRPLSYIGWGGKGKQVRDVLHVDDFARLVEEEIRRFDDLEGETFNVGGGASRSVSLRELTDLCRRVTGRRLKIGSVGKTRPADVRLWITDTRKLESRVSWRPQKSVEDAVEDTVRWMRAEKRALETALE